MAMWKLLLDLNGKDVLWRFSINFFSELVLLLVVIIAFAMDIKYFATGKKNKCTYIVFMLGAADIILVASTEGKGVR